MKYPYDKALLDPKYNALAALVEWVENDVPPETLIGTKYKDDIVGGRILAQRSESFFFYRLNMNCCRVVPLLTTSTSTLPLSLGKQMGRW